ncbi:MAG: M50 family metallopeptidase [Ignavibacteria bacterium]|nr:M50 family metallopeptidase [Ignavibacteria bacterium]
MGKPSQNNSRTADFILALLIVAFSFFLWDTFFVFPIKLFVVFLHESSHALAILLTGGTISEISLGFDLGGKITAEGGNDIVIASFGYLGSLFFGLLIYLVAEMQNIRRYVYFSLASLFLGILLISTPTLEFILIGLITVGLFVVFGFLVKIRLIKIIVKSFALVSAIYVLIDVKEDMLSNDFSSDAQIMAGVIGVDQLIVSLVWLVISAVLIGIVMKYSFKTKSSNKVNHLPQS